MKIDSHEIIRLDRNAKPLTPLHGRSKTVFDETWGWVNIKGGGWSWGERPVLISKKDSQLVFGLFGELEAKRELAVSDWLNANNFSTASVLGWTRIDFLENERGRYHVADICYLDGTKVVPVLLATCHKIPVRVADLGFMSVNERFIWIDRVCKSLNWEVNQYLKEFSRFFGCQLAALHNAGATNDTLTWDNLTIAAEWTDFEWIYVPGIELPDGTTNERMFERQWKSCIDAIEVVDKLAAMIDANSRKSSILACIEGYESGNGPVSIREDWFNQ